MTDVQVLCVDDERSLLELAETFLERESDRISVRTASTADEALDVLAAHDVDCVVSDHDLEEDTGLSFLRTVREEHPDLPFVLFTGKGSEAVAADAVSAGVTDYLQKGGREQYALLANRVEKAADAARTERELKRTREKTAQLHENAAVIASARSREAVVDAALSAADDILEFSVFGLYEARSDGFHPVGDGSYDPGARPALDEGVLGATYQQGTSFFVEDALEDETAAPDQSSFRSAVSVPVGDDFVFQAIAEAPGAFTESDLELTELLATHVEGAFERIEREREHQRTAEQLQAILDNTTAIVYIKDREGRYQLVNDRFREVEEVEEGELVGRTDWDFQPDAVAAEVRANDQRAIEEGEPVEVEEDAHRGGGRRTYYSVKVPLFDDDGDPRGVCGISTDITNLKERERALERERNRLDEFASVVSHDLRGPLSVATGYRELLAEDVDDPRLDEIADAHDRMAELIEDVLSLARDGEADVDREPVSLSAVVASAESAADLPAAVDVVLDGEGVVEADRSRLRRLLENLFRNAVEHGETTSTIRVDVTDDGFAVADDGVGIPPEQREDLFGFGVTNCDDGTGIGLAVVREVAQAHGWSVSCTESDAGGARFEVETDGSPRQRASATDSRSGRE
ncbi:PAS domain-containing protein [Halorubellus sp. JP-L1]|uniref:hybrid sensor histidine kinase/response regulator n=1 Tax=Halorubellus sp. JP-L1 TaxID=2715753 RepID=UPI001409F921|nr:PAS domain-containing protein [Halorubellus sp. JP-L1]NHN40614.1 PAS domain-containing protein [Halorubellus sp. JP-L1]